MRGLKIGLASVQLILFGKEVILLDRFGSSGGNIVEFSEIVSDRSMIDEAVVFNVICDDENDDDAEPPCILTLANTAKSCAEDIFDTWPGGDCSPSLVFMLQLVLLVLLYVLLLLIVLFEWSVDLLLNGNVPGIDIVFV